MQQPHSPMGRVRPPRIHRDNQPGPTVASPTGARCTFPITTNSRLRRPGRWRCLALSLSLSCLAAAPLVDAKIYKWIDTEGNVHYTDQEPPDSAAQSEKITIAIEEPAESPDEGEIRRRAYLQSAADLPDRRAEAAARETLQNAANAGQLCQQARVHGEVLKLDIRVYRSDQGELRPHWFPDAYEGPRTYISDAERPLLVDANEAQIRAHCADPTDAGARLRAYNRWLVADWCDTSNADLTDALQERARSTGDRLDRLRREVDYWCGPGAG